MSLKVVTWSDFWPAAGEKFGILDHPTLLKCVVFVVQTVEYEPKMLKNFRLTTAEASKIVIGPRHEGLLDPPAPPPIFGWPGYLTQIVFVNTHPRLV